MADGLVEALAKAQANFGTIVKAHVNPHFKSNYADLSDVLAVVRPCLNAEGVLLTQPVITDDDGRVRLYTILEGHGEKRESCLPLYLDNMTPQQLLSSLTYYRRGMLAAMLAVAAEDDDDGNAAQTAPPRYSTTVTSSHGYQRGDGEPKPSLPDDWDTRPLASMTFAELRAVAEKVGHAFSGGSKAELIRQLEPLVRAASGTEPFEVTANAPVVVLDEGAAAKPVSPTSGFPEPEEIPFNPVRAARASLPGSQRKAVDSSMKAEK